MSSVNCLFGIVHSIRSYFEAWKIMLRNSLIREMNFKANFLLWMATELLWFLGQIVFIEVIFQFSDRIGDWTKWEVVLLVGTHQMISQIFQAFFYANITDLPELVRTGRMDFMLLLPMDAQFIVSMKRFGFDSLINAFIGASIVVFSLWKLGTVPSWPRVAAFLTAVGFGVSIHYSIMFLLASVSFWIVRAQGLIYGYYNLFNIARYPESVFRGWFRLAFTWVVPVVIVANTPARFLTGAFDNPWLLMAQLVGASLVVVVLTRVVWTAALRRYSSASS